MSSQPTQPPTEKPHPLQNNPDIKVSQTALDIKLVAIPISTINSLELPENATTETKKHDSSENRQQKSWIGDKFKKYKDFQKGVDTKFVRMPVNEYELYWARDGKGNYCGTEPEGCEEGRRLLKERLLDEEMQRVGKKNVEEEIIRDWKPLEERSGWANSSVIGVPSVT